jgi:hypothetical protein
MLQYYSFKAENIAKQQKCWELWQYTWRHRLQLGLDCDVRKFPTSYFTIHGLTCISILSDIFTGNQSCNEYPCKVESRVDSLGGRVTSRIISVSDRVDFPCFFTFNGSIAFFPKLRMQINTQHIFLWEKARVMRMKYSGYTLLPNCYKTVFIPIDSLWPYDFILHALRVIIPE